jgi:hypothetical protein
MIALRGGFYQGYPTYGAALRFLIFYAQFVSYAEEVGGYAGQAECSRYLMNVAIRW